jgi:2-oxoglutarate dehydrogenase E2 component (dihydrolipoamide succinyltransferase)
LVKKIALEENISFEELESIEGSGANGRVQKKDVINYLENEKIRETEEKVMLKASAAPVTQGKATIKLPKPKVSVSALVR